MSPIVRHPSSEAAAAAAAAAASAVAAAEAVPVIDDVRASYGSYRSVSNRRTDSN